MIKKNERLRRLFNGETGKSVIIPMDHGFMGGFEDIVSDRARPAIESFATKAKKRWKKQTTS